MAFVRRRCQGVVRQGDGAAEGRTLEGDGVAALRDEGQPHVLGCAEDGVLGILDVHAADVHAVHIGFRQELSVIDRQPGDVAQQQDCQNCNAGNDGDTAAVALFPDLFIVPGRNRAGALCHSHIALPGLLPPLGNFTGFVVPGLSGAAGWRLGFAAV